MKAFIFTLINSCQSLSGLQTATVKVKKLKNPDRVLLTQKRPEKSKSVGANCQGSFVYDDFIPIDLKSSLHKLCTER